MAGGKLLEKEIRGKQEGKAAVDPRGVCMSERHELACVHACTRAHTHRWAKNCTYASAGHYTCTCHLALTLRQP